MPENRSPASRLTGDTEIPFLFPFRYPFLGTFRIIRRDLHNPLDFANFASKDIAVNPFPISEDVLIRFHGAVDK